jgi:hypothetical protein
MRSHPYSDDLGAAAVNSGWDPSLSEFTPPTSRLLKPDSLADGMIAQISPGKYFALIFWPPNPLNQDNSLRRQPKVIIYRIHPSPLITGWLKQGRMWYYPVV